MAGVEVGRTVEGTVLVLGLILIREFPAPAEVFPKVPKEMTGVVVGIVGAPKVFCTCWVSFLSYSLALSNSPI